MQSRRIKQTNKTKSAAFGPQANYTDSATANGRRILVPIFMEGMLNKNSYKNVTLYGINKI
jgi:hypothetical protein